MSADTRCGWPHISAFRRSVGLGCKGDERRVAKQIVWPEIHQRTHNDVA